MKILLTDFAGFIGPLFVRAVLAGVYRGLGAARAALMDKLTGAGYPAAGDGMLTAIGTGPAG